MSIKTTGPNGYWWAESMAAALAFGSSGQSARTHREEAGESLEHVMWPDCTGTTGFHGLN
jgi:hypothetical protein